MSDLSKRIADLSPEKREILLRRLSEQQKSATSALPLVPRRSQATDNLPLSFAQESLWFIDQLTPGSSAYNLPYALRLSGPLDAAALEQSLHEIVKRHESLRTAFPAVEGHPVQVIAPVLQTPLSVVDLRDFLLESERHRQAQQYIDEEVVRPFNLAQGPLLRTTLIRLAEQEHILLLLMHHIISDGWSISILVEELTTLYKAFTAGQPSPLAELPVQFADYALWQREWLQGERLEKQLAYWKQQLSGAPSVLELPADHPRPAIQTFGGASHSFRFPARLTERLRALSQQEGGTLFMTLLAAFNVLLSRYTGQEDIVVGSPIANRNRTEIQGLIAYLVNMLVLRTDLSGNPSFRELLKRVNKKTLEAYAHQDLPFEKLVEALQPERSLSHTPLFQVAIANENASFKSVVEAAGLRVSTIELAGRIAKFDLTLFIWEESGDLVGAIEYNADLFEAASIQRMSGHFQTLLEGVVADPERPLSELPLLPEAERHQVLVEWNATSVPYPKDQPIHRLFEAQVERTPENVALIFEGETLTYRELNRRANQLAHHLRKLGVGPEVGVGLCMERSLEMVVSLLGILKAGGAYVPLDTAYPKERLAFMLQDTQAPVLLAQKHLLDAVPTQGLKAVCLDKGWEAISGESTENLPDTATSENLAYVMYTSGSTGKPKGVEIRHFSIARLVFGANYARLDETRTILHMAPISFDASTLEVWGALLHGARCVLLPERLPTPKSIGETIHKHRVTTVWLTASLFNAVIDEAPEALLNTEQVLTGGEALSVAHIRRALECLPDTQLINGYGPTESTTFACCYAIPRPLDETVRSISIGRPISNTQIYILDRHLHPSPIGVPGELYIGGDGLARGYLNRPELTREKFVPHPFSDDPEARLYKTGDIVRYLSDGTIEFLGRVDHQVKIRGFRIEPGEIEVVLGRHPAIREAVVIVREQEREKRLVAYAVPHHGQQCTTNELRSFLREQLPEYMVPSDFMVLDSIPVTPNGKVDRQALPVPDSARHADEDSFVPPQRMIHYQLLQIWESLLEARPIGIRDNFFHLGGHSLLAARLVDRIEQIFRKKLSLATLFAGPTIEQLAIALEQQEDATSRAPVMTVQVGGDKRPFFFVHGAWDDRAFYCFSLARALGKDQPFYTIQSYLFDPQQIPPTFEEIAAAHVESLRTIQPEGPYLLGGFCNGALMVYEIAQQLRAAGQAVDLLVLIDPEEPARRRGVRSTISGLGKFLGINQGKQLDWFLRMRYVYGYLTTLKYASNRRKMFARGPRRGKLGLALPRFTPKIPAVQTLREDWLFMHAWVAAQYVPRPYPGKLTFFWSREEPLLSLPWRQLTRAAGEAEVQIIPGTHITCKTDHVNDLAAVLGDCLERAQPRDQVDSERAPVSVAQAI